MTRCLTDVEIRQLAQRVLTNKQYDAWKMVMWECRSKRQTARILGIDRSSLDERLEGADRRLTAHVRIAREDMDSGSAAQQIPQADSGRPGSRAGEKGSARSPRRRRADAEAA